MGGLWAFAEARSETEITVAFPELAVFHLRPEWMSEHEEAKIRSEDRFNVGNPTTYPDWLRALIEDRAN
jgi:hypothetical protein